MGVGLWLATQGALAIPSFGDLAHDNPGTTDGATTWLSNPRENERDPDPDDPRAMEHQHRHDHALNGQSIPDSGGDVTNKVFLAGGDTPNPNDDIGFGTYAVWDVESVTGGFRGVFRFGQAQYAHGFVPKEAPLSYSFEDFFDHDDDPETESINRWNEDEEVDPSKTASRMRPEIVAAFETWEESVTSSGVNANGVPIRTSLAFQEMEAGEGQPDISVRLLEIPDEGPDLAFWDASEHSLNFPLLPNYDYDGLGVDDDSFDFPNLALHEIGHAIGLGHFGQNQFTNLLSGAGVDMGDALGHIDAGSLDGAKDLYSVAVPKSKRAKDKATVGSKGNPQVSFDAAQGVLSFSPGTINFAERAGGFVQNVDPAFAMDPLLGATVTISDLELLGLAPSGLHVFSPGELQIGTDAGILMSAPFDVYFLDGSAEDGEAFIDSFSMLLEPVIDNFIQSPLLDELAAIAALDPTDILDFYFQTPGADLVSATQGFAQSATLEATYFIGPNGSGEDFGDAPDSYRTLEISDGPRYDEGIAQRLGRRWDSEADGQPTPSADGDDRSLLGGLSAVDDEDGVLFGGSFVDVTLDVSRAGNHLYSLRAWWDTNENGVFDHPLGCPLGSGCGSELFIDELLELAAGIHDLRFDLGFDPLDFYSRFRLTWVDDPNALFGGVTPGDDITPFGEFRGADGLSHGEVEDYVVEPGTVALLALGLAGLGVSARHRPRHARAHHDG